MRGPIERRREAGAHYTSEENILKLINPLFMDELWQEFGRVKTDPTALDRFHDKISNLKFLDIITPTLIQFDACLARLISKGCKIRVKGAFHQKGCKIKMYEKPLYWRRKGDVIR
ncbi:MAG: hypothetical protein LBT44_00775 [Clostridiales bacterium]|nr:hypothetical protein [Clostridiales bacterium]